jgi:uncharacterized protein (TIGR02118 family)
MIRLVAMLPRRSDLTHEQFLEHWFERHAPLIAGCGLAPYVRRYEQHVVTRVPGWPEPEFDGITVQWYDSVDAFVESLQHPDNALIRDDEARFLDMSRLKFALTDDPPRVAMEGDHS